MPPEPVVAVEIGTSKVIALVGELREDNHVMITGMGEHPSAGVRKGGITHLEHAGSCLKSALAMAEESGRVAIREVHLAVTGSHIRSLINRGTVLVLDPDGEVTEEDAEEVMEVARAVNLPHDCEVLHTICQHFTIDDQQRVIRPEGMEGRRLAVDMLVLYGIRNRLHSTIRVCRNVPVEVSDVVFSGLCSALSVLTPEQKKSGVLVIDLGGGMTEYVAYADNVVATAGTLGVGGDHVTNDIVAAFNIPNARAERLKRETGSAVSDPNAAGKRVSLAAEVGFPGRTFRLEDLHTVINLRMDEVFMKIRKRLEEDRILHRLGAGVVLTGGGAHLRGIDVLAEQVFGVPCSVGKPRNISGLATATDGPEYATCSGLVHYGFRTGRGGRGRAGIKGIFRALLGG